MGKLIGALILLAIILVGFVLPKEYNDRFSDKYRQGILNMWLSLLCAVAIVFFLLMMDSEEAVWRILSLLLMIGTVAYTGISIFLKAKRLTRSTSSALLSVFMQFLSIAGFVIVILLIIMMIIGADGKKKKR